MTYTLAWCEPFGLPDGTTASLRFVRPEDKPLFQRAASEFSPASMYSRFFTPKPRFSSKELHYLTEPDGTDHVAIVAVRTDPDDENRQQGLAAARFVRDPSDPRTAEFAVIVGDPWQRCGLGFKLLRHLVASAKERGVERFKGDILATNAAAFRLVDSVAPHAEWLTNGIVALVEFPV